MVHENIVYFYDSLSIFLEVAVEWLVSGLDYDNVVSIWITSLRSLLQALSLFPESVISGDKVSTPNRPLW